MTQARSAALLEWYDDNRRDFPWRGTRDPYEILVAEVMSQQTQISRVVERYPRFLARFPTADDLAAASLPDVLAEWSGLGYNRRAAALHKCANVVAVTGWPRSFTGLARLPGVGPYTAAAIASVCFDEAVAAIDTNLRRVLSRWSGAPLSAIEARTFGDPLVDPMRPGDWNQAVMDLAGAHCTARTPSCADCPVEDWCADSSVYQPPRPQGRFQGSTREARGALIRELIPGPATLDALAERSGIALDRLEQAAAALVEEGLVASDDAGVLSLASRLTGSE